MRHSVRRWHWRYALFGLTVLSCLPAFGQTAAPPPAQKIGWVDFKRVLDNAPEISAVRTRLAHEFAGRDAALKADEEKLLALRQRQAQEAVPAAEATRREADALERAIKRTREDMRGELNTRTARENDRVWQKINNSIIEFAREQGYDLILPSPAIYASSRIDITEQVIERLKREAQADAGRARTDNP